MSNRRFLLIGGTHDGEWIILPENDSIARMIEKSAGPILTWGAENTEAATPMPQIEQYVAHGFNADGFMFKLFISNSMSCAEAFERLLDHYKPEEPTQ